jgi:hypothetical protein
VKFTRLPTERIAELRTEGAFDGVFSNFSGLNCVADLSQTAADLATLVPPGAPLIICLSTRFCISEIIWFLLHGKPREAFRRCSGYAAAKVGEFVVDVYYPTLYQVQKSFSPSFVMRSCVGIGITVPPSYVEPWIQRFPNLLHIMRAIDKVLSSRRVFRVIGDHMLISFERIQV